MAKSLVWSTECLVHTAVPWFGKKAILEHEERYKFVKQFIKNKTVVDLGCGSGYGAYYMALNGAKKVFAIDANKDAIEYAQLHFKHKSIIYKKSDVAKTDLAPKSVDVVVSFEVIEHLFSVSGFIQEITRVLKDDGVLVLSTPNKIFSLGDNPFHIREYTLSELRSLLSSFFDIQFFGQRQVNTSIMKWYLLYKQICSIPVVRMFYKFRPWEGYQIYPLNNSQNFLYFVVICRKTKKSH